MKQKLLLTILIVLSLFTISSLWFYPTVMPITGGITLLYSLSLAVSTSFHKHKGIENARAKILKEVGVMVLTLVIVILFGGIAAMLTNYQVGTRWGEVAGLVSAIAASFAVGYLVRKGMGRLAR